MQNSRRLLAFLVFVLVVVVSASLWLLRSNAPQTLLPVPALLATSRDAVASASPTAKAVRALPPRSAAALERAAQALRAKAEDERYDEPDKAAEFYRLKRLPEGATELPLERYFAAREQLAAMPRYSTARQQMLPSQQAAGAAAAEALPGTWESLGPGNVGGRTRALLVHPTQPQVMYAAGVAGGVWKSTNAGASWTPLTDLLANLAVCTLAFDPANPNTIYAGTGEGFFNGNAVRGAGIFKTTDGGTTWTRLPSTNTTDFYYVNDLVISPKNSQRLYAATRTGVWRSLDGGGSWTAMVSGTSVYDLVIRTDQANDVMLAVLGNFSQAVVSRNTDAGGTGTWQVVLQESGMGRVSLALAPSNQNVVYALASNGSGYALRAVFRSVNGGETWASQVRSDNATKLNTVLLSNPLSAFLSECGQGNSIFSSQGWYNNVIAVDPVNENRVWAGGVDLFRSDDGGANWGLASYWWAAPNEPGYAHADQHVLVFHPNYNGTTNKTLYVGNDGGIFRTDDATAQVALGTTAACSPANTKVVWQSLNNNYGVTQFYFGVPFPDGSSYFGGTQDNGTLLGSDAKGPNGWRELLGGDGGYVAVDPANPQTLFAETTYLSLRKSSDGGKTFGRVTFGIDDPVTSFLFITPFAMDPSDGQRLWMGGASLYRTTNGAANWMKASPPLNSGLVSAVAVAATNANYVLAGMNSGRLFFSDEALTTTESSYWYTALPRTGYVSSVAIDPTNPLVLYATYSTFGGAHVWRSTDLGSTWTPLDGIGETSLPDIPVHSIVIDPSDPARLYIGTDLGVFVSLNGGASWAIENTGFANVVTESLALHVKDGLTWLYAFTHGRGAYRVLVNQRGCQYALSTSSVTLEPEGGNGTVNITGTPANCPWQAYSNNSWITIKTTSANSVSYAVAPNAQLGPRVGTITVGGRCFTITQRGQLDQSDNTGPTINILSPTTASTYETTVPRITLSGTATGDPGITLVTWTNDRGAGNVFATGTSNWSATDIPLQPGLNRLTITVRDLRGRTAQTALTVYFRQNSVLVTVNSPGGVRAIAKDKNENLYLALPGTRVVAKLDSTGVLKTFAGGGNYSDSLGPALQIALLSPAGLATDQTGNVYITDAEAQRLYKVTPDGQLSTLAGMWRASGFRGDNGPAQDAVLNYPQAVAVDQAGNIYLADGFNYRIRKIRAADGIITTIAGNGINGSSGNGGPAIDAQVSAGNGLAVDRQGNVYFSDYGDHSVRKISVATGIIQRVVGTGAAGYGGVGGPAQNAQLFFPNSVWLDASDNLWITDDSRLCKVDARTGNLEVIAGGGTATVVDGVPALSAALRPSSGLLTDGNGYPLFGDGGKVRKVLPFALTGFSAPSVQLLSPTTDVVTSEASIRVRGQVSDLINFTHLTWANDRGDGGVLPLQTSEPLVWDSSLPLQPGINQLTFTAWDLFGRSNQVRLKVTANLSTTTKPIAGTMTAGFSSRVMQAVQASLWSPEGLAMDAAGNLYVADTGNHRIRKITPSGVISTVVGSGNVGSSEGVPALEASLNAPRGVVLDSEGNLYIADTNNHRLCRVGADGILRRIAGSGVSGFSGDGGAALAAKLNEPGSLALFGGSLYLVDTRNVRVRKVDLRTGLISTYAGALPGKNGEGLLATEVHLGQPYGLAFNKAGDLFISDTSNHRILRVAANGRAATYASYSSGGLSLDTLIPRGLAIDRNENLYVVSLASNSLKKITPSGQIITLPVFTPSLVKFDAINTGSFRNATGLAVDRAGNLYVADTGNHRIIAAVNYQQAVSVSTASYDGSVSASEAIVSVFGAALANTTQAAAGLPLPTSLGGTTVIVRDSAGIERLAPLFYVSPLQVNYQVPAGTAAGLAVVTVISGDQVISSGTLLIQAASPGLFAANADGSGAAALALLRIKADGTRRYEPSLQLNAAKTRWIPLPIDLSTLGDEVFLELYGTGIRGAKDPVRVLIGGEAVPLLYAGAAPGFVGLDQVNVSLPRYLIGRGELDVQLFVGGVAANLVKINVAGTACATTLSATSQTVNSSGGNYALTLTTSGNCNWAAQSQESWLTITSSSVGSGNATVTFAVAPNTSPLARTGNLRIAGQAVSVTQTGFIEPGGPTVTLLSPTSASSYETNFFSLTLQGTITTNVGVAWMGWRTDRGASGTVNAGTGFVIPNLLLQPGSNLITLTVYDNLGRITTRTLLVKYNGLFVHTVAGGGENDPNNGGAAKNVKLQSSLYALNSEGILHLIGTDRIYKVDAAGTLSTVLVNTRLNYPYAAVFDRDNNLHFTDYSGFLHKLNLKTNEVTAYGLPLRPFCFDEAGQLYVGGAGPNGEGLYKFNPATRQLTIIAGGGRYYNPNDETDYGDGKLATELRFISASDMAVDRNGNVYIAESGYQRIRKIDAQTKIITTLIGKAESSRVPPTYPAIFENISGMDYDPLNNQLYFSSNGNRSLIYRLDVQQGGLGVIAERDYSVLMDEGRPAAQMATGANQVRVDNKGILYFADTQYRVRKLLPSP